MVVFAERTELTRCAIFGFVRIMSLFVVGGFDCIFWIWFIVCAKQA